MIRNALARTRGLLRVSVTMALAACLGGCVTYSPGELAAMEVVDLCEMQYMQGRNLSEDTRRAIESDLKRRSDNCRNHEAEVMERYAAFRYREMYGKHDDP